MAGGKRIARVKAQKSFWLQAPSVLERTNERLSVRSVEAIAFDIVTIDVPCRILGTKLREAFNN